MGPDNWIVYEKERPIVTVDGLTVAVSVTGASVPLIVIERQLIKINNNRNDYQWLIP